MSATAKRECSARSQRINPRLGLMAVARGIIITIAIGVVVGASSLSGEAIFRGLVECPLIGGV
jgi:hypothetical protein